MSIREVTFLSGAVGLLPCVLSPSNTCLKKKNTLELQVKSLRSLLLLLTI